MYNRKDLLGTRDLSAAELDAMLDHALDMERIVDGDRKSELLKGKSVFLTFYENSTRTQSSFDHAVKMLGGRSVALSVGTSSVKKGEVLLDTAKTLNALTADVIVIRHEVSGAPFFLAEKLTCAVVNAGDGMNEHPTQSLLDLFTMRKRFGRNLSGLKVLISGDIKHSRVARSNIWALTTLGADVRVCAPATLMPKGMEEFPVAIEENFDDGVREADVVMLLRMQSERQHAGLIPGPEEYAKYYQLTPERLRTMKGDAIIMHPGPVNRGAEICSEAADSPRSVINEQVRAGLCVRMAVLDLLTNRSTL